MHGTFLDFLPPETQAFIGAIALLMAVAGIVLWAAGVKIARFCVAMMLGVGLAGAGAIFLPRYFPVSALSSGLVGFAIGAVAGALGFRLLQGLVLAWCLSVAVGSVYFRWHVAPELSAATQPQTPAVSNLLIPTDQLPTTDPHVQHAVTILQAWADRWGAIPAAEQKHLEIITIATAAVVLLVAFAFPPATTVVVTAILGTIMALAGIQALVHLYTPSYEANLALPHGWAYLILSGAALLGMAIQHQLFWPRKRPPAPPAAAPAPAQPAA